MILDTVTYTVSARWRADATEHTGSFSWPHFVKAGDLIDIWVDTDGSPVSAPAPASHAGVDGVMAGITIWLSVVAAAAALTALVRWRLNRLHSADWDRELWSLEERRST